MACSSDLSFGYSDPLLATGGSLMALAVARWPLRLVHIVCRGLVPGVGATRTSRRRERTGSG